MNSGMLTIETVAYRSR